jgi:iron complex outermembrane receptor protein
MAEVHRNDLSTDEGEDPNGNYTQTFGFTTTPAVKDYFDIYNATITYDFNAVRLLNTASYINQDTKTTDFGYYLLLGPAESGPPYDVYQKPYEQINKAFSDELRFNSTGGAPWQWTAGGSFRRASLGINQAFLFVEEPAPQEPASPIGTPYFPIVTDAVSKASAVFGDTSYKIADRLTLGAGVRYFHDDQSYYSLVGGPPSTFQTGTFHSLDPRAYLQWKLTEDANLYASASKGFRSGGFNAGAQSYDPESIWTYQLGNKFAALDGRLRVDAAVFLSHYSNYQTTAVTATDPVNDIRNAGNVLIKGTDLTVDYSPDRLWTFSLRADYIQAGFASNAPGYSTGEAIGQALGNPKYVFTVSAQRDFILGSKAGFARLDFNQQGHETITYPGASWENQQSDIINMLNFNTGLSLSDTIRVKMFVQNILNDRGQLSTVDVGNYSPRSRPRTLGLEVSTDL